MRRIVPAGLRRRLRERLYSTDPEAHRLSTWRHGVAPRVPLGEVLGGIDPDGVRLVRPLAGERGVSVDPLELLAICAIERAVDPTRILEIGTFDGGTTVNLAANGAAGCVVTTVDLPPDWAGESALDVPDELVNVTDRAAVGVRFAEGYSGRIRQVFGDSAALHWDTEIGTGYEFAFIDGNHSYAYVVSDTRNVIERMAPGGVIVWHDYGLFADVSRAVDECGLDAVVVQGTRVAVARVTP